MPGLQLSPGLCKQIVSCVQNSNDLVALSRVSKDFHKEASAALYAQVKLMQPVQIALFVRTLTGPPSLIDYGILIRIFVLSTHSLPRSLPQDFWPNIQRVFFRLPNLRSLVLRDTAGTNSWVLDHPNIPFQIQDLELSTTWDHHVVRFLQGQSRIKMLFLSGLVLPGSLTGAKATEKRSDDVSEPTGAFPPGLGGFDPEDSSIVLPNLQVLAAPLGLLKDFEPMSTILRNAQLVVPPFLPLKDVLQALRRLPRTMKGINLQGLPTSASVPVLEVITQRCPNIRHFGTVYLPICNVSPSVTTSNLRYSSSFIPDIAPRVH